MARYVQPVESDKNEDTELKTQILIAMQNARDYFDIRNRKWVKREVLEKWVVQNYYDPSQMAKEMETISSYYNGEYPVPGTNGEYCYEDPYQDPEYIDGLRRRMDFQRSERLRNLEGYLQEAARTMNLVDIRKSFSDYSPLFYLKRLTGGKFMIISGDLGSGKTDLACTFAEIAIKYLHWIVLSGIELKKDVENYIYCRTLTKLLYEACKAKLAGKRVLFILDEGGLEFPSYRAVATPMQILDRVSKLFRKLNIDWIFISQRETQIPMALKMYYAIWYKKIEKTKMEMLTSDAWARKELVVDIPRTSLPFDTDHTSTLSTDITIEEILRFLEEQPPRTNQFEALKRFLEEYIANKNKSDNKEKSRARKTYIYAKNKNKENIEENIEEKGNIETIEDEEIRKEIEEELQEEMLNDELRNTYTE